MVLDNWGVNTAFLIHMFINHLKIAWRVFNKRKLYGIINLLGLSVGVGFTLLVVLFVNDEFNYDDFHEKGDRLYLLHSLEYVSEDLNHEPGLFDTKPLDNVRKGISQTLTLASLIEENVPEVEKLIEVEGNYTSIEKDGKSESLDIRYVDEAFFNAFTFNFKYGNANSALNDLNKVVITDEVARTFLGAEDVVGEFLQLGGNQGQIYQVGGVIEKPKNSVFTLDVVVRHEQSRVYKEYKDGWRYSATALFLLLNETADPAVVAQKIDAVHRKERQQVIDNYKLYRKLSEANPGYSFDLKNIEDLFLDPTVQYGQSSSPLYSYILLLVATIIVIIACINYVAIASSMAGSRSTEVALRKVMGSGRSMINRQFYTEAFATTFFAILLGYSLMQLSLPMFNELAEKSLSMSVEIHFRVIGIALVISAVVSLMAGTIPARIMSRISVVKGLKSHSSHRVSPTLIRSMVVFQFTLCIFFIGMGLTMQDQFEYMGEKDLGYEKEQLVYISNVWGISDKMQLELNKEPSIAHSAGISGLFGFGGSLGGMVVNGKEYRTKRIQVDYGFIETLGLELVSGRDFDRERNSETEAKNRIVNETMYNLMLSDSLYVNQLKGIIGVVKDFNYQSLVTEVGPIAFELNEPNYIGTMFAKLQPGNNKAGIEAIQAAYDRLAPNRNNSVIFMDQYLENQYTNFYRWAKVINLAAIITVLIAGSGLFGLTALNVMNRMKEMGIRKVLGAGLSHILILLNKQTLWLILMAMAVSFPLWYYFSNSWADSFAYRTNLSIGLFVGAALMCLVIVLVTMGFHGFKTSKINPTQLLRNE